MGSNHSTTACAAVEGGTLIEMAAMNRILGFTTDSVTVEAGALYIDIAAELEKLGLQFFVNTEIGNLTAGSAACRCSITSSRPNRTPKPARG